MKTLYDFSEIWMADFEYSCDRGEMPKPICLVAKEYKSKKTVRIWEDELLSMTEAPFENGADSVFVAYYSPAEFSCFHSLGWALPANVFDLFTEFRAHTNGRLLNEKSSLLAALKHFGFSSIESAEKDSMRDLALREVLGLRMKSELYWNIAKAMLRLWTYYFRSSTEKANLPMLCREGAI
jgi:DNA polymerase-1